MIDDRQRQNKGRIDAPWFKFYPAKFITMTAELNPSEVGGFVRLLCAIHVNGEAIVDDSKRLARRVGLRNAKAFDALRSTLLDAGLIEVKDGLLSSPFSQDVFANIAIADTLLRKNVSAKKAKSNKNQSKNPAEEEADTEVDAQAPSEPVQSHSSHTSDSDGDAPARDSAGSSIISVGDDFNLPGVGSGWIEAIESRAPLVTIVMVRDKDFCATAYRIQHSPTGELRPVQISLDEADRVRQQTEEDTDAA